jgi:pyruvate dehydrogenase E2 component (dihydrolipoamide acetyltransferase)
VSSSRTETTIEVTMPQMGVSVAEGTITDWVKRPGDWVEADEIVCIVTTDKVDVEIPAPASGRLERVLVEVDQTVPVGTPLAEIDPAAKPGQAHPQEESSEAGEAPEPAPDTATAPERPPAADARSTEPEEPPAADERPAEPERSGFYSPVVRRIAAERGIDLERVEGTGIGGRVRKADLMGFLEDKPAPPSAGDLSGPTRRERMSPMRAQIARHMLDSRRASAHCTTIVEVDFSRVARQRQELREAMGRRGVNLTYLAFVARAAVAALERHPVLNAFVEGEEIVYHDQVNLGIAVALESGLIVPVIRQAERLSLEGLAAAIGDLATRAREKRLHPDEVQGGTFTITNPGQFGAVLATPIINQPQVAILDLEAIVKRPIVLERDGGEAIAIRPMSYLCMSWDHRALDGAEAARFLAGMKSALEDGEV